MSIANSSRIGELTSGSVGIDHLTIPVPLIRDPHSKRRYLRVFGLLDRNGDEIILPLDPIHDQEWFDAYYKVLEHRFEVARITRGATVEAKMARELQRSLCSQPYGIGHIYWLMTFGWIKEPRAIGTDSNVPFILTPRQLELILERHDCMAQPKGPNSSLQIEKSRSVGVTWIGISHHLWAWQFTDFWSGMLMSIDFDSVDKPGNPSTMFWKIDYLMKEQPGWLLPRSFASNKRRYRKVGLIINPDTGSVITAVANTDDAGRGERHSAIDMDEAGFAEHGGAVYNLTNEATDHRFVSSTATKKYIWFFNLLRGLDGWNPIRQFRFEWWQYPGRGGEWREQTRLGMRDADFKREYLIDYEADSEDLWVYPQSKHIVVVPRIWIPDNAVSFACIDDGYDDDTAIGWGWISESEFRWIDSYSNRHQPISLYGALLACDRPRVKDFLGNWCPDEYALMDRLEHIGFFARNLAWIWGDRHGDNTSTTDGRTPFSVLLDEFDIYVHTQSDPRLNYLTDRRDAVMELLPQMTFEEAAAPILNALQQSIFPKTKEGSQAQAEYNRPVHSQHSHFRTVVEYACVNYGALFKTDFDRRDDLSAAPPRPRGYQGRRYTGNELEYGLRVPR